MTNWNYGIEGGFVGEFVYITQETGKLDNIIIRYNYHIEKINLWKWVSTFK